MYISDLTMALWALYDNDGCWLKDGRERRERLRVKTLAGETLLLDDDEETALEAYHRMRREALVEALEGLREGKRLYSRRVISVWSYQRERLRSVG